MSARLRPHLFRVAAAFRRLPRPRSPITIFFLPLLPAVLLIDLAVESATLWSQQANLIASDRSASDQFGFAVAVQGDTALVGAYAADTTGAVSAGSAYVFTRSGIYWTEQVKLTASDGAAYDKFGNAVALSGDTALVGADNDDTVAGATARDAAHLHLYEYQPIRLHEPGISTTHRRSDKGTLTLHINGALFVGHESRLLGKTKPR